ncbi:MAG: tetratricopeptide repeat protein [Pseudomonadota bacterium]
MSKSCSARIAAFALLAACAASPAFSDDRTPSGRTVIGGDHNVAACEQAAAQSDISDRGIGACDTAIRRGLSENDRIIILVDRGILHTMRHEGDAAVEDFNAAIAINPRNAEAHLNLGAALVQLGRPGPAVAALTTALGLGVREPHKAYYNRGAAREALGDLQGAYEDYTTALQIEPDWGPAEAQIARFVRSRQEHLASVLNVPQGNPPQAQP